MLATLAASVFVGTAAAIVPAVTLQIGAPTGGVSTLSGTVSGNGQNWYVELTSYAEAGCTGAATPIHTITTFSGSDYSYDYTPSTTPHTEYIGAKLYNNGDVEKASTCAGSLVVAGSEVTDLCPNLDGVQATLPDGYALVDGQCVIPQVTDLCPNLDGVQATLPDGYVLQDGQCVIPEGPVTDLCPNLDGVQATLPDGYALVDGQCVIPEGPPAPSPPAAPAVPPRPENGIFLCYSAFQTQPGAWLESQAKKLFAQGYWMAYAVKGNVPGGTNVGKFHLVCNLAGTQAVTDELTGDAGENLGPAFKGVFGLYPVIGG